MYVRESSNPIIKARNLTQVLLHFLAVQVCLRILPTTLLEVLAYICRVCIDIESTPGDIPRDWKVRGGVPTHLL